MAEESDQITEQSRAGWKRFSRLLFLCAAAIAALLIILALVFL